MLRSEIEYCSAASSGAVTSRAVPDRATPALERGLGHHDQAGAGRVEQLESVGQWRGGLGVAVEQHQQPLGGAVAVEDPVAEVDRVG